MILALAMIQVFASVMTKYLGTRKGAILKGFFGGLVSSTATTASLARESKLGGASELLTFLSATGAMLFEGLAIMIAGTAHIHFSTLLIFIGPILAIIGLILFQYRRLKGHHGPTGETPFEILPILKLSAFIVAILAVSKISQNVFGQNGLLLLTSLVSFFEIHGSIIASVQLHEEGAVTRSFLCGLLAISVLASYLSKLFLISTLGSSSLRSLAIKNTFILIFALAISWVAAVYLSS